jgi:hypothetical protein
MNANDAIVSIVSRAAHRGGVFLYVWYCNPPRPGSQASSGTGIFFALTGDLLYPQATSLSRTPEFIVFASSGRPSRDNFCGMAKSIMRGYCWDYSSFLLPSAYGRRFAFCYTRILCGYLEMSGLLRYSLDNWPTHACSVELLCFLSLSR